jgi:hypothetical protein
MMSSSTSVGQRLYILLSVLAALAPPVGLFLVRGAEDLLLDTILKECQGGNVSLFSVCIDKALKENNLALWQYLLPFLPAISLACGRWVLGVPRPLFTLSGSRLYLIAETFLVIVAVSLVLYSGYSVVVDPLRNWEIRRLLKIFYLTLGVIGTPLSLSMLLERATAERSYKFLRLGTFIVFVAPIAGIAILIFRQASGGL